MAKQKPPSSYTGKRADFELQSSTSKSRILTMQLSILNNILKCCMLLFLQAMHSQSITKAKLTTGDYEKWSTLIQENISPNGKWITYKLRYDSGNDTLFIRNTGTTKEYFYPEGNTATFSNDNQWIAINQRDNVVLQNLKTGKQKIINSAIEADFILDGKLLLLLITNFETHDLLIMDLKNGDDYKLQNVKEYSISSDKKSVGYITQFNTVELFWYDRKLISKKIFDTNTLVKKNLVWNDAGNSIAFLEETPTKDSSDTNHKIYYIEDIKTNREVYCINPLGQFSIAEGKAVLYNPTYTPLLISPDNKKIFFYIKGEIQSPESINGVEVWNSNDRLEFKRNLLEGNPESRPKLVAWYPESNKILEITNNQHHSVYLTPDRHKAIIFDPHQYEPQEEIMSPSDLWLTDLNTGDSRLILEKQSRKMGRMGISPNSRYLNYYKDKNWWIFDMESHMHTMITAKLTDLEDLSANRGGEPPSYGVAGWSDDSQYLILYTRLDVWLVSTDGKILERLTNGEADGIRYRVCTNHTGNKQTIKFYDIIGSNFNLKEGLVLEAFDIKSKASGFHKWSKGGKLSKMIFKNAQLNRIKKSSQKDNFILIEQKTNAPPQIIFLNNSRKEKILVKTNGQQDNFDWTKSELISYKNSEGINLQGVLLYPADYRPEKKYPMIVHIYEDQSYLLHHYYNPSIYMPGGFSPTNYTSDGYFVLYPDIVYKEGAPGYFAVDCVEAAVKEVMDKDIVEENSIGLIGHSFGGYETSFIITQSNLFTAAVAGAACTDLVAHSLTLQAGNGRSQMWRYQTHQMRMGKSLYEDYIGFIENSPVNFAQNINTALLSWTGKNDTTVDPQQSIALHMAMRSLKKPHLLLLYPEEGHILMKPNYQKDLTLRVKAWFDHYLKNKPFPLDLKLD